MMAKIIHCVLAVALFVTEPIPKPNLTVYNGFKQLYNCVTSMVDFTLMATLPVQNDMPVSTGVWSALDWAEYFPKTFHDKKGFLLLDRSSVAQRRKARNHEKKIVAAAMQHNPSIPHITSNLRNTKNVDSPFSRPITPTSPHAQLDFQVVFTDYLAKSVHFKFLKMHALVHCRQSLVRLGALTHLSTAISESSHRQQLEDGWAHCNRHNVLMQIVDHYARCHAFEMRILNLRVLWRDGVGFDENAEKFINVVGSRQRGEESMLKCWTSLNW